MRRGYAKTTIDYDDLCLERDEGDPKGEFLAPQHASPVWSLVGKRGVGIDATPPGRPPVGDTVRYHCPDWRARSDRVRWRSISILPASI